MYTYQQIESKEVRYKIDTSIYFDWVFDVLTPYFKEIIKSLLIFFCVLNTKHSAFVRSNTTIVL